LCAVYAFARTADDFADEAEHDGHRLDRLSAWEEMLECCLRGDADHPVFVALGDTIRRHGVPDRLLRDLLDAFRQDCRVRRYEGWGDLLDYSRRSANPVGRIVLRLFDEANEERDRWSDAVCTGLQLTNFWQDVSVDLRKDRIYIPREDLRRFGVEEDDLRLGRCHRGVRELMLELVARTRETFRVGRPLVEGGVSGRLGIELRLVWLGGHRILKRIEAAGGDVLSHRPVVRRAEWAGLSLRAVLRPGTVP